YIPGDVQPSPLILPSKQIFSYLASRDSIVNHDNNLYARRLVVEPSTGESTNTKIDGDYLVTEKSQWHKVARGETLTSIARKYGITVAALKSANGGIKSVKRGQEIKIVTTIREKRDIDTVTEEMAENTTGSENEAEGDERLMAHSAGPAAQNVETESTQQQVETKTQVTATQTTAKNTATSTAKKNATASPKSKTADTANTSGSGASVYTVKKGDSLYKIAQAHGTTVDKLMKLNGLSNNKLQIGDKLKVK
ncbi:MAG: LysM peptidoglycan-binding domain-containing protein, partial [Muribaculaceae bacterium]|nr:LysM peptidoglycan-binding domain-containing protein [Muribaculaceae bacterium]